MHPRHVNEISPEWLTKALREGDVLKDTSVTDMRSMILGEGRGFLSSVARVELEYDTAETGAPGSVVVKIEPDAETLRRIGDEMHAFEREIRFYRDVADQVPIRLPRVYFSLTDPPDYAIVMEDLSFCTPGDQIVGMHEEQVLATTRIIGRLQARYWNNPALDSLSWMPLTNGETEGFDQYWPSFVEHFGGMLSGAAMEAGKRVGEAIPWLEAEEAKRPHTLVHSDLRADNLLFGPPDSDDAVLIVDWQLTVRRSGAYDVARLMGGERTAGRASWSSNGGHPRLVRHPHQ